MSPARAVAPLRRAGAGAVQQQNDAWPRRQVDTLRICFWPRGPVGPGVMGRLLFDAWCCLCQWTSGARLAAVRAGGGLRGQGI